MKKVVTSMKGDKAKLAAGAEAIRIAQKEAKQTKPVAMSVSIPASTRPIEDIVRERVKLLPGHIGLRLHDDTPIEEALRVLDWTLALHDHVGFLVGDVLNYGDCKWGQKYEQALIQTGRARSTLKKYASTARRIAPSKRIVALPFSHHYEVLALRDEGKIDEALKELGKGAASGTIPTTKELRFKVQKLTPRKVEPAKRVTSGKGKKKAKPEPPPYEPSAEEQAKLDSVEDKAGELAAEIKSGGVTKITFKLDNKEKRRLLAIFEPIVTFYNALDRLTGY